MPTTRILVGRGGKIIIEGIGYVGGECLRDLERLLEVLRSYGVDTEVKTQQLKPEAYVAEEVVISEGQ